MARRLKGRTPGAFGRSCGISRCGFSSAGSRVLLPCLVVGVLVSSTVLGQEIQSLEHDSQYGFSNSLVHVGMNTYALAYAGAWATGWIKTFTIPPDGSTITEIQSLEHDVVGLDNSLVHVDGDTYVLAYAGDGTDGWIKTFSISADGSTITEIQSLEHDLLFGLGNSLVQVDVDTYALAYTGGGLDGFVKTFTVAADGSAITEVQSLEHDPLGAYGSLVHVDADTYAVACSGDGFVGVIKTFTISADGSAITEIQSLEHDPVRTLYSSLFQIDANTYALAYTGDANAGILKTFTISADGSTITEVQAFEHDALTAQGHSWVRIDADTLAIAYAGGGDDGILKTFKLSPDAGTLAEIESLEHDPLKGNFNSLIHVDGETYALAYSGDGDDGFIKTFRIDAEGVVPVTLTSFGVD